jgi:hypothetical protein
MGLPFSEEIEKIRLVSVAYAVISMRKRPRHQAVWACASGQGLGQPPGIIRLFSLVVAQ